MRIAITQNRRVKEMLAVAALAVLPAGCGGGGGPEADVAISGAIQANATSTAGSCERAKQQPEGGTLASFYLDLGGLRYGLRFLTDHDGPGTYTVSDDATFVALNGEGPGWSTLTDDAGKLVVNRDGRSGTIDTILTPEPSNHSGAVRVVARWHC